MKQMDKVVAKFSSHEEARKADLEYYRSLTPAERIDILLTLVERARKEGDASAKDLSEFMRSLNSHGVEYVVVGGYALAFHGAPRFTGDIDLLVRRSPENAAKLEEALNQFGFGSLGLSARDFEEPDRVIQLGRPPNRIDLLTAITGVEFDRVWMEKVAGEIDGIPVYFIGRDALIANKAATGRAQDIADLDALESH